MRVKAIQDLAQLTDDALFVEIDIGTHLCVSNARRLHDDSLTLSQLGRRAGAEVLRLAAQEEAAKVLILLDAVRCPRLGRAGDFSRQLQYFNDHMAKGLYVEHSSRRPILFGDVREWVDRNRKEFYLDGPNGVDWIFYNDILRSREETLYVDYVENDSHHYWHNPRRMDEVGIDPVSPQNPMIQLVCALSEAGCLKAGALKVIAKIWRAQPIDDGLTVHTLFDLSAATLTTMDEQGLLTTREPTICDAIANRWPFPLYSLDLRKDRVNKNDLRDIQTSWMPYEND